jgi:four helix bundle protein
MKFERFEDIVGWQKAKELTIEIYKQFNDCKDFSFRDQIRRASVSIMNNIAEGYERQSNAEFKRFLFIAKGSAAEVRSMLILAKEFEYISAHTCNELLFKSEEISKILSGLIKTLN